VAADHADHRYVALEEGLFEKACIEIVSNKLEAPNQIIDALVGARADFGPPGAAAGISMLAESKFPGTFKVFGLQGGGIKVGLINDGLIVKPDSTIKSFADLKGKKLGHIPGIQWRTISRYMVRSAGLDPEKEVTLVDLAVGMQIPAVVGGSVDATLSLEPVGSVADPRRSARSVGETLPARLRRAQRHRPELLSGAGRRLSKGRRAANADRRARQDTQDVRLRLVTCWRLALS
jgi:ABC-type nitrate/sulfonate/bicarbonate transport system substrate-binding protein